MYAVYPFDGGAVIVAVNFWVCNCTELHPVRGISVREHVISRRNHQTGRSFVGFITRVCVGQLNFSTGFWLLCVNPKITSCSCLNTSVKILFAGIKKLVDNRFKSRTRMWLVKNTSTSICYISDVLNVKCNVSKKNQLITSVLFIRWRGKGSFFEACGEAEGGEALISGPGWCCCDGRPADEGTARLFSSTIPKSVSCIAEQARGMQDRPRDQFTLQSHLWTVLYL